MIQGETSRWWVPYLVVWQFIAILLLMSWFIEPTRTAWLSVDDLVFRLFNDSLKTGSDSWRMLWALTNHRLFDGISAGMLVLVFMVSAWRNGRSSWCWHTAVLSVTVIAVLIGTRIGHLIPVERPSGTMLYNGVFRLSEWTTAFETKDISYSTFPGDHGMVALIGCGYAFHYLGRGYALAASIAALVIVLPRLVGGAHWLSDELVGAGFVGILVLSWSFYTPVADTLVAKTDRLWRRILHRK
ncbi:MAG: phosphatase PAP2 family protein [Methylococcaceae bacterium]|nr:phosphatase PAP2 family protein [Methylococcaceae bacterium]